MVPSTVLDSSLLFFPFFPVFFFFFFFNTFMPLLKSMIGFGFVCGLCFLFPAVGVCFCSHGSARLKEHSSDFVVN